MKIEVILVINFNRMDKATGQWMSAELLGMFGNMTIRIMEYDVHGQPKYYTLEVSYEMFTADMHSFIFIIIYIGSQIMHICIYSISNIQCIFNKNTLETCKNPRPTSGWSELTKSCTTSTMNFHMAYFSWIPQNNAKFKLSCKFGESKCNPC